MSELDERWRLFRDEAVRHAGNPARIATVFDDHRARIEVEARAAALDEAIAAVEGMTVDETFLPDIKEGQKRAWNRAIAAVLEALRGKRKGEE